LDLGYDPGLIKAVHAGKSVSYITSADAALDVDILTKALRNHAAPQHFRWFLKQPGRVIKFGSPIYDSQNEFANQIP
jgi:hypothetical protein